MATFGRDMKAYLGSSLATSTTHTTQLTAATEVSNIKDLTLNGSAEKTDTSVRADGRWGSSAPGKIDASITFQMRWDAADTQFTALKTAWLAGSEVFFAALDGAKATSGKQGLTGNFTVVNFTRNEPLHEASTVDVELAPSSYTTWTTVA